MNDMEDRETTEKIHTARSWLWKSLLKDQQNGGKKKTPFKLTKKKIRNIQIIKTRDKREDIITDFIRKEKEL